MDNWICPRSILFAPGDKLDIARKAFVTNTDTEGKNAANIAALALGSEDLSAELVVRPNHELLTLALYDLVKIGCQLNVPVLGYPKSITNYQDLELLEVNVATARQLGARGAFCIHRKQVQVIIDGFSPTVDEIRWAKATLSIRTQIARAGVAVHPLTHQMVDRPVLFQAQNIIERSSDS